MIAGVQYVKQTGKIPKQFRPKKEHSCFLKRARTPREESQGKVPPPKGLPLFPLANDTGRRKPLSDKLVVSTGRGSVRAELSYQMPSGATSGGAACGWGRVATNPFPPQTSTAWLPTRTWYIPRVRHPLLSPWTQDAARSHGCCLEPMRRGATPPSYCCPLHQPIHHEETVELVFCRT